MIAKRILDATVSAVALILLSPLLAFLAVWVRIDSPGPAIFRQQRVGLRGKPFDILKFRSMHVTQDGPEITASGDSRISKSGKFLRKYKLDELPQLWNVLVGDMSLVGPRPEVPRYVAYWPADARVEILSMRPGITDPTALEMFDEASLLAAAPDPERKYIEELLPLKVAGYLRYARGQNFVSDLLIIVRTLRRALKG
jgi:lipopolysaccharide/colanic/teichoic acid biosynthesis glycosyltransferase